MSKNDVTIFENFAPNYFAYVNQCLQKGQPTLLAKIFGVYRVTIKKKELVAILSLNVSNKKNYFSQFSQTVPSRKNHFW